MKYFGDCSSYDPRARPFYTATVLGWPLDLVFVLDTSAWMSQKWADGRTLLDVSNEVVQTIYLNVNSRDRISFVAYPAATDTELGHFSCVLDHLTHPFSFQEDVLFPKQFDRSLRFLNSSGVSNAAPALDKAFNILREQEKGERHMMVIWITGSEPEDKGQVTGVLSRQQRNWIKDRPMLLVYQIGGNSAEFDNLKSLTRSYAFADANISHISNTEDISKAGFYYETILKRATPAPSFTYGRKPDDPKHSSEFADYTYGGNFYLYVTTALPFSHEGTRKGLLLFTGSKKNYLQNS